MTKYTRSISAIAILFIAFVNPIGSYAQSGAGAHKEKVVRIEVNGKDRQGFSQRRFGSGFFVHKEGFLLTNLHVVGTPDDWKVENGQLNRDIKLIWPNQTGALQEEKRVVVVYYDEVVDLVLLRIPRSDISAVRLGDSLTVKPEQHVTALGYPEGQEQLDTAPGIIKLSLDSVYQGFFRFAASIDRGYSGGPLFNDDGAVIGVVNAGLKYTPGTGFAIPINLSSSLLINIPRPPRFVE